MALGLNIALFIGIPAAVIVGLGYVFTQFRDPILGSASSLGETFAGIFTRPITGAVQTFSTAFSDLPDFDVRLPGINISQGRVTVTEESETESKLAGETVPVPGLGDVFIPPSTMIDPETGIVTSDTPPVVVRGSTPQELTIFEPERSILVNLPDRIGDTERRRERLTRREIIDIFPDVIGLFDVRATKATEFIPLSARLIQELGGSEDFRLSGQIFEEIPSIESIGGA